MVTPWRRAIFALDVVQTKFVVPDVAQVQIPALPMLPDLGVDHLP
jgi:hypothetical protein